MVQFLCGDREGEQQPCAQKHHRIGQGIFLMPLIVVCVRSVSSESAVSTFLSSHCDPRGK